MSSELQLDVRHLNRWRRHLVNAYEVKAGMVFIAGKTVWYMPERFKVVCIPCKALYKCSAFFVLPLSKQINHREAINKRDRKECLDSVFLWSLTNRRCARRRRRYLLSPPPPSSSSSSSLSSSLTQSLYPSLVGIDRPFTLLTAQGWARDVKARDRDKTETRPRRSPSETETRR